jgi:hypothetical protein
VAKLIAAIHVERNNFKGDGNRKAQVSFWTRWQHLSRKLWMWWQIRDIAPKWCYSYVLSRTATCRMAYPGNSDK